MVKDQRQVSGTLADLVCFQVSKRFICDHYVTKIVCVF